jgi:cobalt-zinc-cadmium resistance protein CzcA
MKLVSLFIEQRLIAVILALGTLAAGLWAWSSIPIDAFPDVTDVQVMVLTKAPGMSTDEVERQISYPLETAMAGVPRVRETRSMSKNALSQVRVLFDDDVDVYFARQMVFERLAAVKEKLPEGVDPEMGPISTGLGEIYQYSMEVGYSCPEHKEVWSETPGSCPRDGRALVRPETSAMELRTLQDWLVAPALKGVRGVNEVNSFGGLVKQYHVAPIPDKLAEYGLTLREVAEAVARNNANKGGDFVVRAEEQSYVMSRGLLGSPDDLRRIVIRAEHGDPILLGDVADISTGPMARQGAVTKDGRGETAAGMVIMLKGENSRQVVDEVKEKVRQVNRMLPAGIRVAPFYDRTDLVTACIRTVSDALLQGSLFVVLVLLIFLWDLRAALVVTLSLPLSAAVTFLLMRIFGMTANLMSLGGLAIAIGMVVDGSIVVVENVAAFLRDREFSGRSRKETAIAATLEVARPIFFSILVIVATILPLFSMEQIEGKMFAPMAATIVFAMLGSLVVALAIMPAVASLMASRQAEAAGGNPVVRSLLRAYRPSLAWTRRHKILTAGVCLALLAATGAVLPGLGTEFLPPLDEGAIAVNVVRLPTASLEASLKQASLMEKEILRRFPEVVTVVSKTGRAEIAEDPMGPEQSDLLIMLKPASQWRPGMTRERLVHELEFLFGDFPGIRPSFSQPIALRVNELISGVKSDVALKIFGEDMEKLRAYAEKATGLLAAVPGAEDARVEQVGGVREIHVTPDREALARAGLCVDDVNELIETAVGGKVVGKLFEGERRFDIRIRYPEGERRSPEAIRRLQLDAPSGGRISLEDVALVEEKEAPAQTSRDGARRRLLVECNVRGRDLGGFVAEARAALAGLEASLPDGYGMVWGGQFENQERATRRLLLIVPVAILLVLLMQLSALGNPRSVLLVVSNLPFSLVGGILTIWLLGMAISVSVLVGLIALLGMAIQHGTLLVSFIDELRGRGLPMEQAVKEASERRLRPLLMTKLTALLGLLPMLLMSGPGSDVQRPLAAVVLGGLAFTTFLNLYVVPALYPWFHREARRVLEVSR